MKGLSALQAKVAFKILRELGHGDCATPEDIHQCWLADKVHDLVMDKSTLYKGNPNESSIS